MPADASSSETLELRAGESIRPLHGWRQRSVRLERGLFGEERLLAQLHASPGRSARETTLGVLEAVRRHAAGAQQSDDITVMSVVLRGPGVSAIARHFGWPPETPICLYGDWRRTPAVVEIQGFRRLRWFPVAAQRVQPARSGGCHRWVHRCHLSVCATPALPSTGAPHPRPTRPPPLAAKPGAGQPQGAHDEDTTTCRPSGGLATLVCTPGAVLAQDEGKTEAAKLASESQAALAEADQHVPLAAELTEDCGGHPGVPLDHEGRPRGSGGQYRRRHAAEEGQGRGLLQDHRRIVRSAGRRPEVRLRDVLHEPEGCH